MSKSEKTSARVATTAARTLLNPAASPTAKSLAGSVLAQSGTNKVTSARVAGIASSALHDGRTSAATKSLAGSGLTQKPRNK
ncbi:hypothetical protein EYS42_06610 [Aquabacterium lacunae]|uniref:Uncharacterized protein n=1 Tax=Aquabacterium lacunae TaxID=2528630 RepID=A0A4Q9H124_9BURK|nr:hypothetical protein EYS42_06610 [Aquabacterium lacunae]